MYEEHRLFLLQTDFTLSELLAHTQNSIASHVFTLPTVCDGKNLFYTENFSSNTGKGEGSLKC